MRLTETEHDCPVTATTLTTGPRPAYRAEHSSDDPQWGRVINTISATTTDSAISSWPIERLILYILYILSSFFEPFFQNFANSFYHLIIFLNYVEMPMVQIWVVSKSRYEDKLRADWRRSLQEKRGSPASHSEQEHSGWRLHDWSDPAPAST